MSIIEKSAFCAICCSKCEINDNSYVDCDQCHVRVHLQCLRLDEAILEKPIKKTKYNHTIYQDYFEGIQQRIKNQFEGHWRCFACWEEKNPLNIACNFCKNKDGFFVKVKSIRMKKEQKKEYKENQGGDKKLWAHLICLNIITNFKIQYNFDQKCFIYDERRLLKNGLCKSCTGKFVLDIKCQNCSNYYAHSLCNKNSANGDSKLICDTCANNNNSSNNEHNVNKKSKQISTNKDVMIMATTENEKNPMNSNLSNPSDIKPIEGNTDVDNDKMIEENGPNDNNLHQIGQNCNASLLIQNTSIDNKSINEGTDVAPAELITNKERSLTKKTPKNSNKGIQNNNNNHHNNIESNHENGIQNGEYISHSPQQLQNSDKKLSSDSIKEKKSRNSLALSVDTTITGEKNTNSGQIFLDDNLKIVQKLFVPDSDSQRALEMATKWKKLYKTYGTNPNTTKKFEDALLKEYMSILNVHKEYRVNCGEWPSVPKGFRKYEEISEYKPALETKEFKYAINFKLSSKKHHQCLQNCDCHDLEKLGPYQLESMKWKTNCPGREHFMECNEECGCDLSKCCNKSISKGQKKILGQDLKEVPCYGIDFCTYSNILAVLYGGDDNNDDYNNEVKDFIEKKLPKAIHDPSNQEPWNMKNACDIIMDEINIHAKMYNEKDRNFAKILKSAIDYTSKSDPESFRIHSKGYGVICNRESGIPAHELIAEYFGEIYTPSRWFEKQDAIKIYHKERQGKPKQKINVELPDFYNIMLERHKDDPTGYDVLFVDPINKGNYSSRFSHSCEPNCATITTIAKGRYLIGMYSVRKIEYGEELTFDYCSVTENEQEQAQALCLCGSKGCRIYYLSLQTSKSTKDINTYLEQNLCFLQRNLFIFQAVKEDLTDSDYQILDKYSIKDCVRDGCPKWLLKWIAITLGYIQKEKQAVNKEKLINKTQMYKNEITQNDLEKMANHEANLLEMDRVQNLVITVDKVKHALNLVNRKYMDSKQFQKRKHNSKTQEESLNYHNKNIIEHKSMNKHMMNIESNAKCSKFDSNQKEDKKQATPNKKLICGKNNDNMNHLNSCENDDDSLIIHSDADNSMNNGIDCMDNIKENEVNHKNKHFKHQDIMNQSENIEMKLVGQSDNIFQMNNKKINGCNALISPQKKDKSNLQSKNHSKIEHDVNITGRVGVEKLWDDIRYDDVKIKKKERKNIKEEDKSQEDCARSKNSQDFPTKNHIVSQILDSSKKTHDQNFIQKGPVSSNGKTQSSIASPVDLQKDNENLNQLEKNTQFSMTQLLENSVASSDKASPTSLLNGVESSAPNLLNKIANLDFIGNGHIKHLDKSTLQSKEDSIIEPSQSLLETTTKSVKEEASLDLNQSSKTQMEKRSSIDQGFSQNKKPKLDEAPHLRGPVNSIDADQICEYLWKKPEVKWECEEPISVIQDLVYILKKISDKDCIKLLEEIKQIDMNLMSIKNFEDRFDHIRFTFLNLSDKIKKINHPNLHTSALSDILYFYAHTFTYFTSYEYPSVSSEKVSIRKCDVIHPKIYFDKKFDPNFNESEEILSLSKSYSSSYIWGQMCIWWKQTVHKPDASLSQDRRGTLSYPYLSSSFFISLTECKAAKRTLTDRADELNNEVRGGGGGKSIESTQEVKSRKFEYPYGGRENWLDHLKKSPGSCWPVMNNAAISWSFKNPNKIYGTFLFDGIVLKDIIPNFIETVIDNIDKPYDEKLENFRKLNSIYLSKKHA